MTRGRAATGLATAAALYAVAFLVWSAVASRRNLHVGSIILYLACGVALSKIVLGRILAGRPELAGRSGCAGLALLPVGRLLVTLTWPVAYPVILGFLALGLLLA